MKLPPIPPLPLIPEKPQYASIWMEWIESYGRQVREECAKLCDDYSKHLIQSGMGLHLEYQAHGAEACSHLIAGRNEYGDEPDSEHFADSFAAAIRSED